LNVKVTLLPLHTAPTTYNQSHLQKVQAGIRAEALSPSSGDNGTKEMRL